MKAYTCSRSRYRDYLTQHGVFTTIRASRGFKFISYAVWWIRQSILQAIAEQSRIVRLPLNQVGALSKISAEISKFEQENQRKPSVAELAQITKMEESKLPFCLPRLKSWLVI